MGKKGKQETLPGMEARDVPEIEQAAENYRKIRDERCELSKREAEAKSALIQVLKNLGRSFYQYNGLKVQLEVVDNVKVKSSDDGDDEPVGRFTQASRREPVINTSPATEFIEEIEAEEEGNIAAAAECSCGHLAVDHEENGACRVIGEGGEACDCDGFAQASPDDDQERERLHRDAVATWRRERPATVEADEEKAEEAAIEKALHQALHSVQGAAERWRPLRQIGAADAVLTKAIADEWGLGGGSSDHGGYAYKGGKSPQFTWLDDGPRYKAQKLTGKRLLAKVREVMEIGAPGQSNDPDAEIEEQRAAAVETEEDREKYWAEWFAGLTSEEREKYYAAPCSCGHSRDWHGEEDKDICEKGCGVCKCQKYHCPICDTKGGHQANCVHYVLGEGTPSVAQVVNLDDYTADRCDECKRIDGAHADTCGKSNALTFDDYLMYAQAHFKSNHKSHARKMELTRMNDEQVRKWIREKAAADVEAEEASAEITEGETAPLWTPAQVSDQPEKAEMRKEAEKKKKKRTKLSPIEAAIDR